MVAPDGRQLVTCKGAPQIVRDLLTDAAAKAAVDRYIAERASRGLRSLGVATSTDGGATWTLTGLIRRAPLRGLGRLALRGCLRRASLGADARPYTNPPCLALLPRLPRLLQPAGPAAPRLC